MSLSDKFNKKSFIVTGKLITYNFKYNFSYSKDDQLIARYIKEKLNNLYISSVPIYEYYIDDDARVFNGLCYLGCALCILGLSENAKLVRGELLPNVRGKNWLHVWIEFEFDSKKIILDVAMQNFFYEEEYYNLFKPKVYNELSRKELLKNDYLKSVYEEMKNTDNKLDIDEIKQKILPDSNKSLKHTTSYMKFKRLNVN